ncbi:MAG TPA: hypothetical protein PLN83_13115 [Syntrophorhabdus sp.]|nr:hypothetical protein [Syntrophorhabdus sp.]
MLKIIRFFIVPATASMLLLGFTLTAAIADWHNSCIPVNVAVYAVKPYQRIHVRCTAPAPGTDYIFFAYYGAKKFSPDSDRFLNLITFAMQNSKTLAIEFDPSDQSGSKIGCNNSNCRLIQSLYVY